MRAVWALFLKDLRVFVQMKSAVALTFAAPLILVWLFGSIFADRPGSGPSGIPVGWVSGSDTTAAQALEEAFEDEGALRLIREYRPDRSSDERVILTEEAARDLIRNNRLRYAIIVPETLGELGEPVEVKLLYSASNAIEQQMVIGLFQRIVFTGAPQLFFESIRSLNLEALGSMPAMDAFNEDMARTISTHYDVSYEDALASMQDPLGSSAEQMGTLFDTDEAGEMANDFLGELMNIEQEEIGAEKVVNRGATQSVGGWAVMFLLFSVSGAATSLFDERALGLFQRLLTGPVKRTHILWSKTLFLVVMGITQQIVVFVGGWMMFGINIWDKPLHLLAVLLASVLACTSFGMLLAAFTRNQAQASGLATLFILPMSAVGGAMFPSAFMPEFMQQLGHLTLVHWTMRGVEQILWFDGNLLSILPHIGVLVAMAVVVNSLAFWRFRKGDMFR